MIDYFVAFFNIFLILAFWGVIIFSIISIFRYFRDIKQLKTEQNELLAKIHEELKQKNSN